MSIVFDHRSAGTDEQLWESAALWSDAPQLPLDVDRVVVVAAHPDDETLGAAGLISTARDRGIAVTIVIMTDGEGACAGDPAEIARMRRHESIDASSELGAGISLRFIGLPDGGLREHASAVREALTAVLAEGRARRTLLAATWWGDGHRDHRIVGEAALRLAASGVHVVGYPIWMWHWATPTSESIDPSLWRVLPLDEGAVQAKRRAIGRHVSQLTPTDTEPPILHAGMREHFERDTEVYIDVSDHTTGTGIDPDWFTGFYARHDDPWGLATSWYEQRKRDLLLAALPRPRYAHALELGCSTGLITSRLAGRCERVTAVDAVAEALEAARTRVTDASVEFSERRLPTEWPSGSFDLIILSELAYYWRPDELAVALRRIRESLTDDGALVACHWRHPIEGCALTGDDVHSAISASGMFSAGALHIEDDFVLEVFTLAETGWS